MHSHAQPQAQNALQLSLLIPCKYARDFRNGKYQEIHRAPIYKTQKFQAQTMSHMPPESPEISASTNTRLHLPSRAKSFSCADTRHDVMDDISTHYGLIRLPVLT